MPPPVAAFCSEMAFQATSPVAAKLELKLSVVPPTPVTLASLAGYSGSRALLAPNAPVMALGFEPPSPEAAKTLTPAAASCANSACRAKIEPGVRPFSVAPKLIETTERDGLLRWSLMMVGRQLRTLAER